MSRTTQPSTDEPCVSQRTFYSEWEIPVSSTLPNQSTPEKLHQTHDPDPFINISFGPRHHYSPIAPAGKVALQTPQSPASTASSKLDILSSASASTSFQSSSKAGSKPGTKQRQIRTCSLCNEPGHNMFTCPKRPCTRCQQMGHVKTYCDVAIEAASQVSKARMQRNKAMTIKNAARFAVSRNCNVQDGPVSEHEGGSTSPALGEVILPDRRSEETGKGAMRSVRIDDLLNPK